MMSINITAHASNSTVTMEQSHLLIIVAISIGALLACLLCLVSCVGICLHKRWSRNRKAKVILQPVTITSKAKESDKKILGVYTPIIDVESARPDDLYDSGSELDDSGSELSELIPDRQYSESEAAKRAIKETGNLLRTNEGKV